MSYRFTSSDRNFMQEALKQARRGMSWTNPHPLVGAVILKRGKIIARGYHKRFGTNHAEMDALKHAKEDVRDGTMYVTLEPCHLPYDLHGSRVPCVKIIKQAGIKTVHIAMLDSNPEVSGKGKKVLEKAGIKTTLGLMNKESLSLNETYHYFMTKSRPFVAITFSASMDGKIATESGESKWITNGKARIFARNLRSQYQAVIVGINTILRDDPHLGVRTKGKKDPIRIILDSRLQIPLNSLVLRDQNVVIATTLKANPEKKEKLQNRGINLIEFKNKEVPLTELMNELYKRQIISLLVEGGGKTLGSFVDERLVDKVYAFYSPILIGGEKAISAIRGLGIEKIAEAIRLKKVSLKKLASDLLITGYTS